MLTKSSPQVTAASSMLIGSMPQLITIFQTTWITAHLLIITLSISKRPQFGPRIKSLLIEIPQTTVILSHLRFSSRLESKWSILGTKSPLGIYCVFQREILSKSMKEIATRRILHGSLLDLSVQMQNRHRSHRFPPFFVLGFFTFFLMLRQNVRLEFLCTLYSFGYGSIRPYFNLLLGLGPLYPFKKKKKTPNLESMLSPTCEHSLRTHFFDGLRNQPYASKFRGSMHRTHMYISGKSFHAKLSMF